MATAKFTYAKVIQQNTGTGFEDVSVYPSNSQGKVLNNKSGVFATKQGKTYERSLIKYDYEQYIASGYPTRVIFRRSPITKN